MKLNHLSTAFGFLTLGFVISGSPAQAFSFTTHFTASNTVNGQPDPTRDILLDSVILENGTTVEQFSFVKSAQILHNNVWTGGNTGAASSERGDNASGAAQEVASNDSIAASLGNRNLNNIIDTEDQGAFKLNLFFESAVSSLFFWERGMNSDLSVQAIDQQGNLLGSVFRISRDTWQDAGYSIDSTEITETQRVGAWGLSLGDLGLNSPIFGLQLSADSAYNGPDFKVAGSAQAVPEPTTMAGLALAGAGLVAARRRKAKG